MKRAHTRAFIRTHVCNHPTTGYSTTCLTGHHFAAHECVCEPWPWLETTVLEELQRRLPYPQEALKHHFVLPSCCQTSFRAGGRYSLTRRVDRNRLQSFERRLGWLGTRDNSKPIKAPFRVRVAFQQQGWGQRCHLNTYTDTSTPTAGSLSGGHTVGTSYSSTLPNSCPTHISKNPKFQ